jgi:hypothetical protein
MASSLSRLHDHTQTHYNQYGSSGRVIGPPQRPLPENTPHSQHSEIHTPGRIRTRTPSMRVAADVGYRPRGHWVRPSVISWALIGFYFCCNTCNRSKFVKPSWSCYSVCADIFHYNLKWFRPVLQSAPQAEAVRFSKYWYLRTKIFDVTTHKIVILILTILITSFLF